MRQKSVSRYGGEGFPNSWTCRLDLCFIPMSDDLAPCCCRLHRRAGDEAGWTDGDRKLIADVEGAGWYLVVIHPQPGQQSWVFSVGLWHTFRSPELSTFGLRMADMGHWINRAGEQIRAGGLPQRGEPGDGILPGFPVRWQPVDDSWYRDLFGYGLWFYQQWLPTLQMVWPDRAGLFPWQDGAGDHRRLDQPVLWRPAEEHPLGQWRYGPRGLDWLWPGPPSRRVFTTKRIADGAAPVIHIVHDADGDWQFLDGTQADDDITVAHLGEMAARFPDVNELADLPAGSQARKTLGQAWHREQAS
jgi:hypothetical protein